MFLFKSCRIIVQKVQFSQIRKAKSVNEKSGDGSPDMEAAPKEISVEDDSLARDDAQTKRERSHDRRCEPVSE